MENRKWTKIEKNKNEKIEKRETKNRKMNLNEEKIKNMKKTNEKMNKNDENEAMNKH